MLIYSETILFPVGIYLFKVTNKNSRKRCEISPKLTKLPLKKVVYKTNPDSDIHSSSSEENDFSGSDADSDAELYIFVASNTIVRSSHQRCSVRKGLRPATLLKKEALAQVFPVNFVKFLRTPFSQNTSGRLLPNCDESCQSLYNKHLV